MSQESVYRVALVPARGGSKRIKNKNSRLFAGRPVILRSLDVIRDSGLFNEVVVSTDSPVIADLASGAGYPTDPNRPAYLADDQATVRDVLLYESGKYEYKVNVDSVRVEWWVVSACAPLVCVENLLRCAEEVAECEAGQAVIAVCRFPAPVEWAFQMSEAGVLHPYRQDSWGIRSQDLEDRYFDSGGLAVYTKNTLDHLARGFSSVTYRGVVLDSWRCVDIDTEEDWTRAEILYAVMSGAVASPSK